MANLCREAALYPVRDAAGSIEHITLEEVMIERVREGQREKGR